MSYERGVPVFGTSYALQLRYPYMGDLRISTRNTPESYGRARPKSVGPP